MSRPTETKTKTPHKAQGQMKTKHCPSTSNMEKHGYRGNIRSVPNDVRWYSSDPQLLKDAASFPFSKQLGNSIGLFTGEIQDNYVPGIMTINLLPTLGAGNSATDALTVAARKYYTFIRHANSGSANYEAPDLMCYLTSVASAYSFIQDMARAYGVLLHFSRRNRYYAETLVNAMGYEYQMLISNAADFRQLINISKARLNALAIPKDFVLRERWNWVSSNYYVDSNLYKAQTYIYKFEQFFKFDAKSQSTGSSLVAIDRPETFVSLDSISNFVNSLIDPLLSDEDIGIMSGDILKAYGEENVYTMEVTSADAVLLPSNSDEVKGQIMNAFSNCGSLGIISNTVIQTEDGVLVHDLISTAAGTSASVREQALVRGFLMNSYNDAPTPEEVMVSTRLMAYWEAIGSTTIGDTTFSARCTACGTEVIRGFRIYTAPVGTPNVSKELTCYSFMPGISSNTLAALSVFDWHPTVIAFTTSTSMVSVSGLFQEVGNYTVISPTDLKDLHKVAVLSELAY